MAGIEAEIEIARGRWIEAFEASRGGWEPSDNIRWITQQAIFAATAAGDASRLREVIDVQAAIVTDDLPLSQAGRHLAATLTALVASRWDEARMAYLNARRLLEDIGDVTLLARLQLAVGHLAADHFPEAADAAREAEQYFHDRGADAYVATYRAKAVRRPASGEETGAGSSDMEVAEAEPSTR
jgi:hypothetical protein